MTHNASTDISSVSVMIDVNLDVDVDLNERKKEKRVIAKQFIKWQ